MDYDKDVILLAESIAKDIGHISEKAWPVTICVILSEMLKNQNKITEELQQIDDKLKQLGYLGIK